MHRGIHSQKFIEKRRKKRVIVLFLSVLCFVTIAASLVLVFRSSSFQILEVSVEGSTLVPEEKISAAAISALSGSYFHLIPHSNSLLFSKKRLKSELRENFKHIDDLTVHRKGKSGLRILLRERIPAAVVCAGFRGDSEQEECYLSDSQGYIFSKISTTSPSATIESVNRYYISAQQAAISTGSNFISKKQFSELQEFVNGARAGGLAPLGVLIGDAGEYEMYARNKNSDTEATIYFDDRSPLETTLENLLIFWENTVENNVKTPLPYTYINLRFGNSVYYSTQ